MFVIVFVKVRSVTEWDICGGETHREAEEERHREAEEEKIHIL